MDLLVIVALIAVGIIIGLVLMSQIRQNNPRTVVKAKGPEPKKVAPLRQGATTKRYKPMQKTTLTSSQQRSYYHEDDILFMATFPDVAPYFHPQSVWAWYYWYLHQTEQRTSEQSFLVSEENGIPGFESAHQMRCESLANGMVQISLLNEKGDLVTEFTMDKESDGCTALKTESGTFTLRDADDGSHSISFDGDDRSFNWSENQGWEFNTVLASGAIAVAGADLAYAEGDFLQQNTLGAGVMAYPDSQQTAMDTVMTISVADPGHSATVLGSEASDQTDSHTAY